MALIERSFGRSRRRPERLSAVADRLDDDGARRPVDAVAVANLFKKAV
jgi:hypothetical protein